MHITNITIKTSRNSYIARIDGTKFWPLIFNLRFLSQFLTKIKTISNTAFYSRRSTKRISQLKQSLDSISNLGEVQFRISRVSSWKWWKQMRVDVWRRWWNQDPSSKQLRFFEISNCYALDEFWTVVIWLDSSFNWCKQHSRCTCRWWFFKEIA